MWPFWLVAHFSKCLLFQLFTKCQMSGIAFFLLTLWQYWPTFWNVYSYCFGLSSAAGTVDLNNKTKTTTNKRPNEWQSNLGTQQLLETSLITSAAVPTVPVSLPFSTFAPISLWTLSLGVHMAGVYLLNLCERMPVFCDCESAGARVSLLYGLLSVCDAPYVDTGQIRYFGGRGIVPPICTVISTVPARQHRKIKTNIHVSILSRRVTHISL